MKVLLTHAYFIQDDVKEQQIMRPYPPLGILYISAYLEKSGIANEVYDTTFSSKEAFRRYVLEHKPGVIGIYVNLVTKLNVIENLQFLRQHLPDTHIILGGPDVRYNAESYLRAGAEFIAMGEGEVTTLELVNLCSTQPFPEEAREAIAGIAFLNDGKFIQTREREKMKDLDELPLPNRHKIDMHRYLEVWKSHHGQSTMSVSTMRGCPYTCKWCSRAVYGLSYRRRSPGKVAEELEQLQKQYNPDSVWFVDDVFTISHKWLTAFRDELRKRNVTVPYECITRADRMNEEIVAMLKETGCFRVWIGSESGSQKVIDLMDRRVDVQQVRSMIRLSKKHGIEAGTFIMLGYPGETEADIEETIHHLKESNPDHFTITVAYPIKGTELYEEVEAIQTTKLDWTSTTDRQVDFKRTYPRKYYDYAVSHVVNEVNYFKRKSRPSLAVAKLKMLSIAARIGMQYHKLL
jgi:radical SAM superfamily enzyme YgiQ (UPF0313 family)